MMFAVHGLKFEDVLDDAKPDSSEFVQAEISSVQNPCWWLYFEIFWRVHYPMHTHRYIYIYIILGMIAIHRNPYEPSSVKQRQRLLNTFLITMFWFQAECCFACWSAMHLQCGQRPMVLSTGKQQSMTTNTATEGDVDYKTIAAKKFVKQDS